MKTVRTSIEMPEEIWDAARIRATKERKNLQKVIAGALQKSATSNRRG